MDASTVVSDMGEQWSPNMAPENATPAIIVARYGSPVLVPQQYGYRRQYRHSAPRSTGREGYQAPEQEYYKRQECKGHIIPYQDYYKTGKLHIARYRTQRPGKDKYAARQEHQLKALQEGIHGLSQVHNLQAQCQHII